MYKVIAAAVAAAVIALAGLASSSASAVAAIRGCYNGLPAKAGPPGATQPQKPFARVGRASQSRRTRRPALVERQWPERWLKVTRRRHLQPGPAHHEDRAHSRIRG